MDNDVPASKQRSSLKLQLDYRIVSVCLLVLLIVIFLFWRPWGLTADENARTVAVTGETTVTAEPDEYIFMPMYTFTNANKDEALGSVSAKSTEITAVLKELGVSEKAIKTNSSGYDSPSYEKEPASPTYTLFVTVKVDDKTLAQKVQTYLLSTAPTGTLSPQYGFSETKRKELEKQARAEAIEDARAKAEQSAKNLGFSIGNVKTVSDSTSIEDVYMGVRGEAPSDTSSNSGGLELQPGENELHYSVKVEYFIK